MDATNESIVKYSLDGVQFKAVGDSHLFVDGGEKQHRQYIHKVCFIHRIVLHVTPFVLNQNS